MSADYDPLLDSYLSWEAFIAEMRRRWLAGEPISPGPWHKPALDIDNDKSVRIERES